MPNVVLTELSAMQAIAEIVSDLTPAERRRVAAWFSAYAAEETVPVADASVVASIETQDTPAAAGIDGIRTFAELLDAVAPKTGAQKAAVAGWWLEHREQHESWKASEVNKLLKSADVKVSSISIVLTNAVKVDSPLIMELERLGDGERSRKTFCLSERGLAYVEGTSGKTA